jgi:hypothetical protein
MNFEGVLSDQHPPPLLGLYYGAINGPGISVGTRFTSGVGVFPPSVGVGGIVVSFSPLE